MTVNHCDMKVITIHGIRKQEPWDEKFKELPIWKDSNVEVINFDYGYFGLRQFLTPWARKKVYKKFQEFYSTVINSGEPVPSVICHSFGTKILYYSLKMYGVIKFDKVILCGSILNTKTDWHPFFESGQLTYLLNDFGTVDDVVTLSRFVMRDCGNSGKKGFSKVPEKFRNSFHQKQNNFGHSDSFLPLHMTENWAKVLLPEKTFKYEKRILRNEIIDRIYSNIGDDKIEYSKISYKARIDEKGNYFATYQKNGVNKSGNQLAKYKVITTADSTSSIGDMYFQCYDEKENKLSVSENEDYAQNKSFFVHFDEIVNNNEDFSITYQFRWKETISGKGDTDHFEIRNARNITVVLNFKTKLKGAKYFIVKNRTIVSELKAFYTTERDSTHTYGLQYENAENSDGIIFYFEGSEILNNKTMRLLQQRKSLSTEDIEVSKCNPENIRDIYKIEVSVEHSNAATEITLKQRLSMFNDGFLIAKYKGQIAGYLESLIWNYREFDRFQEIKNFPIHYDPNGDEMYIIFLAVKEEYRKKGIAKRLLKDIEDVARKYDINCIKLVAKDDLVNFYKKAGYRDIRELPDFLEGKVYKSVLMLKYL